MYRRIFQFFCVLFLLSVLGASSRAQTSSSVTNVSTVKVRGRNSAPALSITGQGVFYFDIGSGTLQVSQNGGAFSAFAVNGGVGSFTTVTASASVSSPVYTATGSTVIKPGADSTTAIQFENASGTPFVIWDSTNLLGNITTSLSNDFSGLYAKSSSSTGTAGLSVQNDAFKTLDFRLYGSSHVNVDSLGFGAGWGHIRPASTTNGLIIGTSSTAPIVFEVDGVERARIATGGVWTMQGQITMGTGTTAIVPFNTPSGQLKTSPAAGDHEFDGINSYITNDTSSGRGAIPVEQHFKLTSAGGNISTIANYFGTTSNINLVNGAYYEIDIYMWFLNTTSGTVTFTLTNAAQPAAQDIYYEESPVTGIVAPGSTATAGLLTGWDYNNTTAAQAYTTGTLTTAVNHYVHFHIWLHNGTGTSLLIQATKNVGGTITPGIGSRWYCKRISPNNVGAFAN